MVSAGAQRSRLRLIVIQALVVSLFATLLVRLWYLQVAGGEVYQAKAQSQSVREVVLQPDRGLIVDAQGRSLVANRNIWVVSMDRTTLGKLPEDQGEQLLKSVSKILKVKVAKLRARLLNCGTEGAVSGTCWNGSPYQPVPVAEDVDQEVALRLKEQPEDYPGIVVQQRSVRAYPSPYGINAAHLLGYLSPITEEEFDLAEKEADTSLNGASQVGRSGVEKQYDKWLRGMPGYQRVEVNSVGEVMRENSVDAGRPGSTLVTSIDAKVQSVVEDQLAGTIATARATHDTVTGRNYVADSGAALVMEVDTGRIVAMASAPTYDADIWSGGITQKQLSQLYSEKAGTPLLSRATQGQFAPGSTWKPVMTAGALTNGYTPASRLDCSSAFQVGNRAFKNYESGAYGSIGFDRALEVSCNTFFYRIGYGFWQRLGSDVSDVNAKDPLVAEAKKFGFGKKTGIDLPGEASGRIADRKWKRAYYESQKDYYCGISEKPPADASDFLRRFAREFCIEGYAYRAGDAVNFAIGQGDTIVTPLQLARAYAAFANGGTLWEPRIGKAIVDPEGEVVKEIKPKKQSNVKLPKSVLDYIDTALKGVTSRGTMSWRMTGFPLQQVPIRSKTGSAEVYGKQSTSWVASYSDDYVVVMMVTQGGTGSGTSGPAIRKIWESLYGVNGTEANFKNAAIPGVVAGDQLPVFAPDGAILPPQRKKGSKR
ncbi:penicillin-binding protein 2 [Nocardioides sp. Bht2]|uniref:penicillin-binding protein 2 n=1 Tax=Nocardioides sp. Bht2 TaxID=3392297 RepID=UPI0039B56121